MIGCWYPPIILNDLFDELINGFVSNIDFVFEIVLKDLPPELPSLCVLFLFDISALIGHILPKGRVSQHALIETLHSSIHFRDGFAFIILGVQSLFDNGQNAVEVSF
jgi:hypothetical protein